MPTKLPSLPLQEMWVRHPGLTPEIAAYFLQAARVCFDRHHMTPTQFTLRESPEELVAQVDWEPADERCRAAWANEIDTTEAGAYACTLAATELMRGWLRYGGRRPALAQQELWAVLDNVRCVVLDACCSRQQAQAVAEHVECVVGLSRSLTDSMAVGFAISFYQALGFGRNVKTTFELACHNIELSGLGPGETPELLAFKGNPEDVIFTGRDELDSPPPFA